MTDLATWITGGLAAVAAVASAYFAWRADRSQCAAVAAQKDATEAAKAAAESADKAQRIQIRPALHMILDARPAVDALNAPTLLSLIVRNVGHGTAVIERVKLFQYGNPSMEYHDTRGYEQRIFEQFDEEIFLRLAGDRLASGIAQLHLPQLTDIDRALETGASRTIFALRIDPPRAARIVQRFREGLTAQVIYRSLTGDEFNTDQQFADLREPGASGRGKAVNS
jgi:hypothetical protein